MVEGECIRKVKEKFAKVLSGYNFKQEKIKIKAKSLTPQQAIGNPQENDYPLLKGKEQIMQAQFKDSFGQAFTDMYGDYEGTLSQIMEMKLNHNFKQAIFISTLNAVLRHLKIIDKTVHCKNNEPKECSKKLALYFKKNFARPKITIVGFQPRIVETLADRFPVKVTDLDCDNVGKEKFGIKIQGADKTGENLKWCDVALVTGTTIVNNTIYKMLSCKNVIFYGVTIRGAATLLGLNQFCPLGK